MVVAGPGGNHLRSETTERRKKMARSYYDDHFDPGADREELRERHQKKREISRPKVYVRYDEGAELYSMCKNTFIKFVQKYVHKVGRRSRCRLQDQSPFFGEYKDL